MDNSDNAAEPGIEAGSVAEVHALPDQVLEALVRAVNESPDTKIGIALYVSGLVISGSLIPAGVFFKQLSGLLQEADGPAPLRETVAQLMLEISDSYSVTGHIPSSEEDGETATILPVYVHLENAAVWTDATSGGSLSVGLWRGRLSHVSGWSMEEYSPSPRRLP